MPPMRTKRCRLGVATLKGRLYAVGGYDGSSFLDSVERFDVDSCQWVKVASMRVKRSRVAVAASHGRLFAVAGYDGQTKLSSTEMYDPESDSWTFVSPLLAHDGGVGVGMVPECESLMD